MTELKEFTTEEMRGVPPFWVSDTEYFREVDINGYVMSGDYDEPRANSRVIECNPMDRCRAICQHLFELMPIKKIEKVLNGVVVEDYNGFNIQISINPFLHTGITEITREEVIR